MIPEHLSTKLESIQRQALKIIYGWNTNIDELMQVKNIDTLNARREKAVLNFALKNEHIAKYGKKWFNEEPNRQGPSLRNNRDKYIIPVGRTNRTRANPVVNMAIRLNEHYRT